MDVIKTIQWALLSVSTFIVSTTWKSACKKMLNNMRTEVLKSFEFKIRKTSMIGHLHVADYSRRMFIVSILLCPRKDH